MKKLVRKTTNERENMVALGTACTCSCSCSGACNCPPIPSHQIGIGVREQNLNSSYVAGGNAGNGMTWN